MWLEHVEGGCILPLSASDDVEVRIVHGSAGRGGCAVAISAPVAGIAASWNIRRFRHGDAQVVDRLERRNGRVGLAGGHLIAEDRLHRLPVDVDSVAVGRSGRLLRRLLMEHVIAGVEFRLLEHGLQVGDVLVVAEIGFLAVGLWIAAILIGFRIGGDCTARLHQMLSIFHGFLRIGRHGTSVLPGQGTVLLQEVPLLLLLLLLFGCHQSDGGGGVGHWNGRSVRVGVEQEQRLEVATTALVHDVLPVGPHFADGGVVEVNPQLQFCVEEEGGVVFAVVSDDADQPVGGQLGPASVNDVLEHVLQLKCGSHDGKDGHDVFQIGPLRVPDDADRHNLRAVHQSAADLNLGATSARAVSDVAHSAGFAQQLAEQIRLQQGVLIGLASLSRQRRSGNVVHHLSERQRL